MIEILNMESEFIMGGDSYCRKCTFIWKNNVLRTTVTYVNTDEANLIDGFCERYHEGEWKHLNDILPKEATIENLKDMQINLVRGADCILTTTGNDFDKFYEDYKQIIDVSEMFQWSDLEDNEDDKKENVIRLEFNPDRV